ncbi:CRTAC1 family protein [Tuwongella immobilis]|uniref:ASPIC/UnbV domain-containing protein n=1 Tax=Tuwongella immobilis TaxID=692036 RepID=A0A6C2YGU7_9BACT|nr:CRTAC1 family protein [Tuwongella immobilis]VIP00716.1 ASPIC/UnbV domain protein OS=Solibacter usitatus (strain Ellin6076) GN=Acid_3485 PE=4 SV=1: VCBS: VCBS: VCBS: UnbV_ASPIC [Tuwongella immobilis]VTR96850.1 ASPIC/UnbV domain protein OS=Solibacter usitatus (strain Ellin6076) GN=Acid_3485 PE=4 SV=1: VCBS: VCBS: VCBS: UnbV_ASPIC [Tuwongella immobilis]
MVAVPARMLMPLLAGLILVGCQPSVAPLDSAAAGSPPGTATELTPVPDDGPAWFADVTAERGVRWQHAVTDLERYAMPQIIGSGCALHDLDGDGREEILLLGNGGPTPSIALFRQLDDGKFAEVTLDSGLEIPGYHMGVAIGDLTNDGLPEILITQYRSVKLFLNRGGLKFLDITASAKLNNPLWATSAVMVDYDRDGWLDLAVTNYVDFVEHWVCRGATNEPDYCNPKNFAGTVTKLYRNLGISPLAAPESLQFEDRTVPAGLAQSPGPGLGIVAADFTGDGWPDLLIANDGKPNHLWINQRNGTFREEGIPRGIAYTLMGQAQAGMGIALGDVDNDSLLDVYMTHLTVEMNTLWKQKPAGVFKDVTPLAGLTQTRWRGTGFGTLMRDFDRDGWLDLAIVNGRVSRESVPTPKPGIAEHWQPYAERNQLLRNRGNGQFADRSRNEPAIAGHFTVARGLASADWDHDGRDDLLMTAIGEPARLLRNVGEHSGHWLQIRAMLGSAKRDALGAEVRLTIGNQSQFRLIQSAESYLSASSPIATFGLGDSTQVDAITIRWPDGQFERFPGGAVDRRITLTQGQGTKVSP